jgi:acyl-CoA hydrolase
MEARMLESVFPTDTNPNGRLFGGQLVAWMDKAAGYAAMRCARNQVVTAAIREVTLHVPVNQGDILEFIATVERIGRTSMDVRVDVFREDIVAGTRESCTTGQFVMVSVDENGTPVPVPTTPSS